MSETYTHISTVKTNTKPNSIVEIEVDNLCTERWLEVQQITERLLSTEPGVLIMDPIERNKRINAAYAGLWLADHRFQWAGLAAFASKQVGCGLLHAVKNRDALTKDVKKRQSLSNIFNFASRPLETETIILTEDEIAEQFKYVNDTLMQGNTLLFLDIYPLHLFYKRFGFKQLKQCLNQRKHIHGLIGWITKGAPGYIKFGEVHKEIIKGFEAIESGNLQEGVTELATHEQFNILQPTIYSYPKFVKLLRANQIADAKLKRMADFVALVTGMPSGMVEDVQLTLATQCTTNTKKTQFFSDKPLADLSNKDQRMEFVRRAANQFDKLLHDPKSAADIEKSLSEIEQRNHNL